MEEQQAFGSYLRKERESRQIPLSDVALATKIPRSALEVLEGGAWEKLPAQIYVKGFITAYAKQLGLPTKETCALYNEVLEEITQRKENQTEPVGNAATEVGGNKRFGVALFVLIVLIIATITLSIIWRSGPSKDTHASNPQKITISSSLS